MTFWITVLVSAVIEHVTLLQCEDYSNFLYFVLTVFEFTSICSKTFLSRDIAETSVSLLIAECGLLTQNKSSEDWNLLRIVNLR